MACCYTSTTLTSTTIGRRTQARISFPSWKRDRQAAGIALKISKVTVGCSCNATIADSAVTLGALAAYGFNHLFSIFHFSFSIFHLSFSISLIRWALLVFHWM